MSLGKKLSRLTRMGPDEILSRVTQAVSKHTDVLRYKMGSPVKINIGPSPAKKPNFFFASEDVASLTRLVATRMPEATHQLVSTANKICAHRFDLLGYKDLDYGADIRWHADVVNAVTAPNKPWPAIRYLDFAEVGDVKVTWELNRHQHLSILARAYLHTKDRKYIDELQAQWHSWQKANPYPMGVNWTSSLEYAFRAMSWIWVLQLLSDSELPDDFRDEVIQSLALHGRNTETYISTYFSANTHLLGESVALIFIGALFPQIEHAQRWRHLGWDHMLKHAREKVLSDGAYFEQSTYYHVYATDMFLHARILAERNGIEVPAELDLIIRKMLEFLAALHSGGVPARFGDDDGGRWFDGRRNRVEHLSDPLCIGAAFYNEPRFKLPSAKPTEEFLWLLGEKGLRVFENLPTRPYSDAAQVFPDTGTYILTNAPGTVLTIDAGPLGGDSGGHGHADALSVNLTVGGEAVLVDPGTYQYVGKDDARNLFRTTPAHNTVSVNGKSQTEPRGPFSWAEIATSRVWSLRSGRSHNVFVAETGSANRGTNHQRVVVNLKSQFILMSDTVVWGNEMPTIVWHLAPSVKAKPSDDNEVSIGDTRFISDNPMRLHPVGYEYSPAYGCKESAASIEQASDKTAPWISALLLTSHQGIISFHQLDWDRDAGLAAYAIGYEKGVCMIVLAHDGNAPWSIADIESDADFLYFRRDENGNIMDIIAHNGSWAKWNGQDIFRTSQVQPVFESSASLAKSTDS